MVHFRRSEHDSFAAHGAHCTLEDDGQQDFTHWRLQRPVFAHLRPLGRLQRHRDFQPAALSLQRPAPQPDSLQEGHRPVAFPVLPRPALLQRLRSRPETLRAPGTTTLPLHRPRAGRRIVHCPQEARDSEQDHERQGRREQRVRSDPFPWPDCRHKMPAARDACLRGHVRLRLRADLQWGHSQRRRLCGE